AAPRPGGRWGSRPSDAAGERPPSSGPPPRWRPPGRGPVAARRSPEDLGSGRGRARYARKGVSRKSVESVTSRRFDPEGTTDGTTDPGKVVAHRHRAGGPRSVVRVGGQPNAQVRRRPQRHGPRGPPQPQYPRGDHGLDPMAD